MTRTANDRANPTRKRRVRPRRDGLADALDVLLGGSAGTAIDAWARGRGRSGGAIVLADGHLQIRTPAPGAPRNVTRLAIGTRRPLAITDPAELWEALAARGVIPMPWVGARGRRFERLGWKITGKMTDVIMSQRKPSRPVVDSISQLFNDASRVSMGLSGALPSAGRLGDQWFAMDTGVYYTRVLESQAHPFTAADCVALAADVAGIVQAEAYAREFYAALEGDEPGAYVWHVDDAPVTGEATMLVASAGHARRTLAALRALGYDLETGTPNDGVAVLRCPQVIRG